MERAKTLLWFGVTFVVLVLLVVPGSQKPEGSGRPTTENTQSAGLAALTRWLASANIPVHSQRQRFTETHEALPQATGNLVIVHLPATLIFEADEVRALLDWTAAGNRLLIITGHLEGSAWVYDGQDPTRALWRLTGLGLQQHGDPSEITRHDDEEEDEEADEEATAGEQISDSIDRALSVPGWLLVHGSRVSAQLRPMADHPLTQGIESLTVPWDKALWERTDLATAEPVADADSDEDQDGETSELPWQGDLNACIAEQLGTERLLRGASGCVPIPTPSTADWKTLFAHTEQEQPALLAAPLGSGELIVLLHPSLLANEVMHRFDNRQLAINLIDHALAPGGTVVIDDAHQGLNNILESSDLLTDGRFWASIAFIVLFWVAYLLADAGQWQRAIFRTAPTNVRQQDIINSSAGFLQERLQPSAAIEAMLEPLTDALARKWRLPRGVALQQGLEQEREHHPQEVAALERLLSDANESRPALDSAQQHITALRHVIA